MQGRSHRGERRLAICRSSTSSRQARRGGLAWNPPLHRRRCALAKPAFEKAGRNQIKRQGRRKALCTFLVDAETTFWHDPWSIRETAC